MNQPDPHSFPWAVRGFDSIQDTPGWKWSLVRSQPVASYRFAFLSWCWSKCFNRCSVHSWSDGFRPNPSFTSGIHRCHLLSASIPLTGIVYNFPCGYAITWFTCSIWVCLCLMSNHAKAPNFGAFADLGRVITYRTNYCETVGLEAKNTFWSSARGHLPSR